MGGKTKLLTESQSSCNSNKSAENTSSQDNITNESHNGNIEKSTFATIVANSSSSRNGSNQSTDNASQRNDTQSVAKSEVGTGTETRTGTGIKRMMTADVTDLMGSDWRLLR